MEFAKTVRLQGAREDAPGCKSANLSFRNCFQVRLRKSRLLRERLPQDVRWASIWNVSRTRRSP